MATRARLGFLKFGLSHRSREGLHIVVMGAEDVGKTALVVRFLTRKYLSEYSHNGTIFYERNICVDGKIVSVRVTDSSGKESFTSLKRKGVLDVADGFMVVYSLTEKRSFFKAKELLKLLHEDYGHDGRLALCLIGNKDDLDHFRCISTIEAQRVGLNYSHCIFHECSAAREPVNVVVAFHDLLRQVIQCKEERRHPSAFSTLSLRPSSPRRNSAGNSTLSTWWRRTRCSSVGENRQDRTFTM